MPRLLRLLLIALAACALAAGPASAASRFTIRGAGFGHGVGMSQYGAYGFAKQGYGYADILAHYYTGTALGSAEPGQSVRVLLRSGSTSATFSGASQAGARGLDPAKTYVATRGVNGQVGLRTAAGNRVGTFTTPLQVAGETVRLSGSGSYRGALEFRSGAFGLSTINVVGLDDYVRGVVSRESPASWPLEALKAQAVAARTYAIATSKGGDGFDQYADTRSQVYGGVGAETPSTDQAVAETAGQVVTYEGAPVVTYFFSTSGGRTEDVENVFGGEAEPWLRSVDDPYDNASPRHRWGPIKMSLGSAGSRLGGLVKGRFKGIKVVKRGESPRVVKADVIGSRGRTRVSGAALRARFGLYDTWAYYSSIASRKAPPPTDAPTDTPPERAAGEGTGGAQASARMTRFRAIASIAGTVLPARAGQLARVQIRRDAKWHDVVTARVGRDGAYRAAVTRSGLYRVVFRGDAGPAVRING
jgi:stage II sporulation protein D